MCSYFYAYTWFRFYNYGAPLRGTSGCWSSAIIFFIQEKEVTKHFLKISWNFHVIALIHCLKSLRATQHPISFTMSLPCAMTNRRQPFRSQALRCLMSKNSTNKLIHNLPGDCYFKLRDAGRKFWKKPSFYGLIENISQCSFCTFSTQVFNSRYL